ncbi:hypothetical protein PAXRUDRAFT_162031 [Paxillus rubicundulus Ve08.2h10]|uniref:Uncharacterized protein n=1 Tax=Paxillus rubicundulus Ve08.2h10 TaxID=930991 RepID=A0A0D0C898_9AGAM|nr:hypothetical protein PAXRUDRAFT_162031 [Paxillus rubicundulus Ve08.2h10]
MPSDFDWATLPLNDLTHCLVVLHLDILTKYIWCLLAQRRPTLNSRSRQKTCNGLIIHICEWLKYLLTVGYSMVCDILLCYLPFTAPSALPDSHYILLILKHEYGDLVIQHLSCTLPSKSEDLEIQWQIEWPTAIPVQTTMQCLRQYCEGSKWSEPSVCAVCMFSMGCFCDTNSW